MILIISTDEDQSTTEVMQWLKKFNASFIRINDRDTISLSGVQIDQKQSTILLESDFYKQEINLDFIKSVWYRRGSINIKKHEEILNYATPFDFFLSRESGVVEEYIQEQLAQRNHINKFDDTSHNKLKALQIASQVGLAIPQTFITSSKSELLHFSESCRTSKIITKALGSALTYLIEGEVYTWHTTLFNVQELLDKIPDFFFPTLFQEYLEKKYELRIFFLKGKFYASAIFSQYDTTTKVDFRNYNDSKPNRVNPYILPNELSTKISNLMLKLGLNSGSIDVVYTLDNKYVFLEVNPIGQFAQVSKPCNYFLEREIALHLLNDEYEGGF